MGDDGMSMSAMAPLQPELARERQRNLLAIAAAERDASQARLHRRIIRKAERAERRQLSHRDQAIRLRARLEELESVR
jgi:hypothetical protein